MITYGCSMGTVGAEGWYVDPFGAHEARWMSDDRPTALVRDGDQESNDPPPELEDMRLPLVPFDPPANWDEQALSKPGQLWEKYPFVPPTF